MVAVLIATYRRFDELKRCLDCLERQTRPPDRVVVIDNAAENDIKALVESYGEYFQYLPLTENKGCGSALKAGEQYCLVQFGDRLSHFFILDDDAVLPENTLAVLLAELSKTEFALAAPLLTAPEGTLFGFPDQVKCPPRRINQSFKMPQDVQNYYGNQPVSIRWCVGTCFLVKASAVGKLGFHRDDFWMCGEDIEFSLRVCQAMGGILVPSVVVRHLYPQSNDEREKLRRYYLRIGSMTQNVTYTALYLHRNSRNFYYIFANYWRFLKDTKWAWRSFKYAWMIFWNGAILAEPSGKASGERLRAMMRSDWAAENNRQ